MFYAFTAVSLYYYPVLYFVRIVFWGSNDLLV